MRKMLSPLKLTTFTLLLTTFTSCFEHSSQDHQITEGKHGVFLGGAMRLNEVENFKSLNPIAVNEMTSFHIGTQLFEGLVKFNQNDLSIMPAISNGWQSSEDQTEWIFQIRKNITFHDDACFPEGKGRVLTINDIKYCFDKLCTNDPNNTQFDVTFKDRVVGANEAFEASKTGKNISVSGVKIINDSTISISLKNPIAGFLNIIAMPGCWIYPKEAVDKYKLDIRTHPVGTGPFYLETLKEGQFLVMKKNPDYYGIDSFGNKLPYLDGLKYTFINEKKTEILEFKSGNLDVVYRLPVEIFHELMGDLSHAKEHKNNFQILNSPAFNTTYIGFNCANKIFNKKEIRLAFNYAIDRQKIADFTIRGEGTAADYGIVPYDETFEKDGYNYKKIKGYTFDVTKAKEFLKQAGYPDGKKFPKTILEINAGGGDRNILVAGAIQKMLKENLNIDIDINVVSMTQHVEQMSSGKSDLFSSSWVADYPDPETFLTIFYGKHVPNNPNEKSYINLFRYKNHQFDSLFQLSFSEPNLAKRYALLSKAEQIMLNDAPCMPIFYNENYRLEQLNVRNFSENAMNYMDLSIVYLIPENRMNKR